MATAPNTAKAAKAETTVKRYVVLTPIDHDLEHYTPGEPIDLTDDQARTLVAVKAIEPVKAG